MDERLGWRRRICWGAVATVLGPQAALAQDAQQTPIALDLGPDWQWLVDMSVAGNELWRIVAVTGSLVLAFIAGKILRYFLNSAAKRWESRGNSILAVMFSSLARATLGLVMVFGLQLGLQFLLLNTLVAAALSTAVSVLMTVAVGFVAYSLISVIDAWMLATAERTPSKLDDMLVPLVRKTLKTTVLVLVIVQVVTVLSDKPATSIIAGLGVGGLAVGLAAQDTIKNVFGSMMIFGDRPFELGDEITVDSISGTVEAVGFRSTRFRTGDGHLVTIPNGELASKTIINVSKRPFLQRKITLPLAYETPLERVEEAVRIVREIVANHEGQKEHLPPRVFFTELGPTTFGVLVQYWFFPAKWWDFVALNERVNFEIVKRFQVAGIELAYPAQRLLVDGVPGATEKKEAG